MSRDQPLPRDVAALLEHERAIPKPPPGAFSRVQARLQETIIAGPPRVPRGIGGSSIATKLVITAAFVVVSGAIVGYVGLHARRSDTPARAPAARPEASVVMPTPPPPSSPEVAAQTPETAQEKPTAVPPQPRPRVADERAILDEAEHCLSRQVPACALAAVAKHVRFYPHGALSEERDALHVRALESSGDVASARERARAFLERYPNSIHAPVIQRVLDP